MRTTDTHGMPTVEVSDTYRADGQYLAATVSVSGEVLADFYPSGSHESVDAMISAARARAVAFAATVDGE